MIEVEVRKIVRLFSDCGSGGDVTLVRHESFADVPRRGDSVVFVFDGDEWADFVKEVCLYSDGRVVVYVQDDLSGSVVHFERDAKTGRTKLRSPETGTFNMVVGELQHEGWEKLS